MFPGDPNKNLRAAALQGGGGFSLQGNTPAPNVQLPSNIKLGPVQTAHPQPLQVGNSQTFIQPSSQSVAGAKPSDPLAGWQDYLEAPGMGALNTLHGAVNTIPALVGQLKPLVPRPFDHYIDTARSGLTSFVGIPFNAVNNRAANLGYTDVNGNQVTSGGRTAQRVGSDITNAYFAAQAARDLPALFKSGKNLVSKGVGLVKGAKNIASSPEGQFAIHAAEDLPTEAGAATLTGDVAGQMKVDQDLAREAGVAENGPQTGAQDKNVPTADFTPEEQAFMKENGIKNPNETADTTPTTTPAKPSDEKPTAPTRTPEEITAEHNTIGQQIAEALNKGDTATVNTLQKRLEELDQEMQASQASQATAKAAEAQTAQNTEAQAPKEPITPPKEQVAQEAIAQAAAKGSKDDPLAALKQEALKYKSADEFVNSHSPVYHGTNADLTDISQLQSGRQRGEYSSGTRSIFASENPELASKYGKNVLEGRNTGKVLDTTKLGDPHDPNKLVVPKEFADYTTNPLLDATDRRVLTESYFKGGTPSNITIDHKPNIQEYFRSKGYSAIQIPRGSDVHGPATEMSIIDHGKIKSRQQLTDLYNQAHAEAKTPTPEAPVPQGADISANQITKLPTELPKQTNALQRTFLSVSGELSKMGDSGQEIARRLGAARDTSETGQAWFMKQIPTVLKLNNKEFPRFVDALKALSKGEDPGVITPNIQQAINEWSQAIPQVREVAGKVGLDVGDLGPYYFPQNYSELLNNQAGLNKTANALVKSGQAKTIGEALQQLQFMKRQYSTKFGHFEESRKVDLPGYDKSKNALISYIQGAFNKIGDVEQFGPKGEIASKLISQLGSEGQDAERASRLVKIANGTEEYNQPGLEKVSGAMRAFNRVTKLGLSAILNAGQLTNTATKGGFFRTVKDAGKFLTKNDRDFIDATGVNADSVLSNLREQTGVSGKITGKITAPGFNAVERLNRGTSALVGRDMANVLHEKAIAGDANAEQALRQLGVEGDLGPELTPQQQIQAARKFVEQTQFKVDPQDLPAWANSPMGKMAAQFRTFSYKQQKFMWDEVVKQATQGNVLPLLRFVTVGSAVGYVTGQARGVLRGQPWTQVKGNQENPTQSDVGQFLTALNNVGGAGLVSNAIFPAQNVKSSRFPQYLASSVLGPTAGFAVQTATNVSQAAAGNPSALERQGLNTIPIAGPFIANKTMPFKTTSSQAKKAGGIPTTGQTLSNGDTLLPVTDNNGQAMTDAKGKAVTVTIPKGVTGPAKDALVADAKLKAVNEQMINTLSPNEKAIYKLGNPKVEKLHNEGKIDDATYDHIHALYQVSEGIKSGLSPQNKALARQPDTVIQKAYDDGKINDATFKEISDYKAGLQKIQGKGTQSPEALTNKDAINFYKTYNGKLTAYDQKKFLDNNTKPEQSAVNITNSVNQNLPPGLNKFKPTNQFALDYAKYEQDINSHPEYDEVDKLNKLKSFLKGASLNQHNQDVQSVYNEGSSGDLTKLLKKGKLTPGSLQEAIALDDNLYTSGVTDGLKFSAKFRRLNGFGVPSTQNTIGGSGGSGGSGSSSNPGIGKAQVTTKNGVTKNVAINAQGYDANNPIGLSNLVPRNLTFKQPTIDTTPTKQTFKIKLPDDVTGTPRPQRVVALRAKRARIQ